MRRAFLRALSPAPLLVFGSQLAWTSDRDQLSPTDASICLTPQISKFDKPISLDGTPFTYRPDGWLGLRPLPLGATVDYETFGVAFGGDTWSKRDSFNPEARGRTIHLTVGFINGSASQWDAVRTFAPLWTGADGANVQFHFRNDNNARIRITFDAASGNWSRIGRTAKSVSSGEPTMNLGALALQLDDEATRRIVLHEFGHALGLRHEHQHPAAGIPWNVDATVDYYQKHFGWSRDRVQEEIFDAYRVSYVRKSAAFDRESVMLYAIPKELTDGEFEVIARSVLSTEDKRFVSRLYPQ